MTYVKWSKPCSAHRTNGEPCGNYAIRGGTVCMSHGGRLPNVRKAARERIDALAPRATEVVEELMDSAASETVRLAAARDVLDRAGVGEGKRIEITVGESAEVDRRIAEVVDRLAGVQQAQAVLEALKAEGASGMNPARVLELLEALPEREDETRRLEAGLCPECRHQLSGHAEGEGCECGCLFGTELVEAELVESG